MLAKIRRAAQRTADRAVETLGLTEEIPSLRARMQAHVAKTLR
jgi:hypothetical protein